MNIATQNNGEFYITLKEITDLISRQHSKAMLKVEELVKEPSFGTVSKIDTVYNDKGQKIETYLLNRKQAIAVGAKLNNSLLMKVIDKVDELERLKNHSATQLQLPDFTNPAIAARAWADEVEQKMLLSQKIVEKDKVILAVADLNIRAGDVTIGDFSKNLAIEGLGQNNLFTWLRGRGFLMVNTAPYQKYVERGYFVRKPSNKKINGEVRYTTLLTPKGTIWLTKMLKAEYDLD